MKTLIAYYSRTNITKKVATDIAEKLDCDIEQIKPKVNYGSKIGYARGIKDAMSEKIVDLETLEYDPSDYDEVILGVPVWASKAANPLISYIDKNRGKFKNIRIFVTAGSTGFESTIKQIEEYTGLKAAKTLQLRSVDVKNDAYESKIKEFIE
ncbi:MAG: flavodoxin [Methanosphaera sp.]|nr:flavodoxin [Methanosphaera sp.]